MTEVATGITADQNVSSGARQIEDRIVSIRYFFAMVLIALGGIVTVAWAAFLGWAVGGVLSFW
jgi:hypothetical protein